MKTLLISIFFSFLTSSGSSLFSEHFIGMNKTEISKKIAEGHRSFKLNSAFINNAYNYLKYEDRIREITVLFFLDDDENCRMIRIMSDYSNLNDLEEELNNNYNIIKKDYWHYNENGVNYDVKLEEGDWFFTISIKENKDRRWMQLN